MSVDSRGISVLAEAEFIIHGDREQQYGSPERNFTAIANQWRLYLLQKHRIDVPITAEDYCWMMADMKKVRQMNRPKRDNLVDAAGYIGSIERV